MIRHGTEREALRYGYEQTGLRLDIELLERITAIAQRERRSLNSQIEYVIAEFVERYEQEHGPTPTN